MPTRYSIQELLSQVASALPDNTNNRITPADIRGVLNNILATVRPAYGVLEISSDPVVKLVLTSDAPTPVAPYSIVVGQSGDVETNATAGSITHKIQALGNTGGSSRVTFTANVAGPNNASIKFTIYKNGRPTTFSASVMCKGGDSFGALSFNGFAYTDGADAEFTIHAVAAKSGTFMVNNVLFIVENVPANSYNSTRA